MRTMQFSEYVKRSLRRYGVHPRKRFGQSFSVNPHIMRLMVKHAEIERHDVVLEIGSGFGHLTEMLAKKAGEIIAVEIDAQLVEALREKFQGSKDVRIIHGDFLKLNLRGKYNKVVSDPPYAIASKILFKLLEEKFSSGILLFQEEFARSLVAEVGSKDYSRLTVMTRMLTEVELVKRVPSSAFYPQPRVASFIVKLKPLGRPPFNVTNWKAFEEIVRLMFSQKRRKVRSAVKLMVKRSLIKEGLNPLRDIPYLERRIVTLEPIEFEEISRALHSDG
jgi:16S rRNA (adenine1518-N6/adenine1519-N6)-dimethyltransferase